MSWLVTTRGDATDGYFLFRGEVQIISACLNLREAVLLLLKEKNFQELELICETLEEHVSFLGCVCHGKFQSRNKKKHSMKKRGGCRVPFLRRANFERANQTVGMGGIGGANRQ